MPQKPLPGVATKVVIDNDAPLPPTLTSVVEAPAATVTVSWEASPSSDAAGAISWPG